jgi:hypothetical protein
MKSDLLESYWGANNPFSENTGRLVDAEFAANLENWGKLGQIEALLRLRIRGPSLAGLRFKLYRSVPPKNSPLRSAALLVC